MFQIVTHPPPPPHCCMYLVRFHRANSSRLLLQVVFCVTAELPGLSRKRRPLRSAFSSHTLKLFPGFQKPTLPSHTPKIPQSSVHLFCFFKEHNPLSFAMTEKGSLSTHGFSEGYLGIYVLLKWLLIKPSYLHPSSTVSV